MSLGMTLIAAALVGPQAAATPRKPAVAPAFAPFVEFKAGPGTRCSVLEVKEAPRETLFALVPTGLIDDEAKQAQLAHLLEHMLIRSTEKEGEPGRNGLSDGEISFNGETNEVALRLEVYAPPKQTGAALKKLVGWLQATRFDNAAVLQAEKQKIAVEVDTTSKSGFTHKWALAAWNQVVRRSQGEAAVLGDVMAATAETVETAADERIDLAQVRLVAVGPVPVDEMKQLVQQELAQQQALGVLGETLAGATAKRHAAEAEKRAKSLKPLATGDLVATWDLPKSHLLAWYLLPDGTADGKSDDRGDSAAAALALSQLLNVHLQSDAKLAARKVVALASADAVVPEGRVLMLSASYYDGPTGPDGPPRADAADVQAGFDAAVAEILAPTPQFGTVENFLKSTRGEFASLPDFKLLRRQYAGRPGAELLEAQVALSLAMREQAARHSCGELGDALARLTRAKLEALVKERLVPAKRSTLRLAPKG